MNAGNRKHRSAHALKQVAVRVGDGSWRRRTLLPFFDDSGRIYKIAILAPRSGGAWMVRPEQMRINIFGMVTLSDSPRRIDQDAAEELAPYWHYDPWWLLRKPGYHNIPWTGILKATNLANKFVWPVDDLSFDDDLTHVIGLWRDEEVQDWTTRILPEKQASAEPVAATASGGWQLRPFWQAY